MSAFGDAVVYLNDPYNWTRTDGYGIFPLLGEHLAISAIAVGVAAAVALPLGTALGHGGRGGGFVVGLSNVSRAVPVLALLTVFAVTPIGFGDKATTIALAVFAFPPILTNTWTGFRGVDPDVREAARAMGMTTGQSIARAEVPLALPLVMTGIRTATVQVVATATLAALVGGGGLGTLINLGFGQQDYRLMIAGAILVAILALLTEFLLALLTWAVTPGQRQLPFRRARRRASPPVEPAATVPL